MAIFTLQHMCVKYCRRLLRKISKHVFFFYKKSFLSLYLCVIYMDQLLCGQISFHRVSFSLAELTDVH